MNLYEEIDDLDATENREASEEAESASDKRELGDKVRFSRASHFVKGASVEVDVDHLLNAQ